MLGLYRRLLRLYPSEYFREYADEMSAVFHEAHEAARRQSIKVRALFWMRELSGVVAGAGRAQFLQSDWYLFRRLKMRSEFRFPRTAIVLMSVVLGVVVIAIKTLRGIAVSYPGHVELRFSFSPLAALLVGGLLTISIHESIGYAVIKALRWVIKALRRTGLRK